MEFSFDLNCFIVDDYLNAVIDADIILMEGIKYVLYMNQNKKSFKCGTVKELKCH